VHGEALWANYDVDWDAFAASLAWPEWQRDAACAERPDVSFFGEKGTQADAARAVCAGCLVRDECLAFALEHRIEHGVWGGTVPDERRVLLGKRPVSASARRRHSDGISPVR